jgi:hypothetical protein
MTIHFSAGDEPPVDLAEVTESLLREAAEELGRCLQKIRAGKLEEVKATPALTRNVKDAFELVQEERGRFDKLRKQVAGTVGTRALDFHAARDEIGRRLARLRDAEPG